MKRSLVERTGDSPARSSSRSRASASARVQVSTWSSLAKSTDFFRRSDDDVSKTLELLREDLRGASCRCVGWDLGDETGSGRMEPDEGFCDIAFSMRLRNEEIGRDERSMAELLREPRSEDGVSGRRADADGKESRAGTGLLASIGSA